MRTGTMFAASVESSNEITIGSGDLVNQGRHINIPTNATEKATINNGTQGKTRKDVIAIRYKQDASTGVESAELIVLQGTWFVYASGNVSYAYSAVSSSRFAPACVIC